MERSPDMALPSGPERPTRRRLLVSSLAIVAAAPPALARALTEKTIMKLRCVLGEHVFTVSLDDNPTARDLASLLPLELTIENYADNEKIAYLPRKLTEESAGAFANEAPGDLCYYAPWGNLAFFHADYRYSKGLIRLGRLDEGVLPLKTRGKFPLHIERVL
jgi:hypothetical protein